MRGVWMLLIGTALAYTYEPHNSARALCGAEAPATAFLVGGLARGFSLASRHLSLKRAVEDWGAPAEVFLVLKLHDRPPDGGWSKLAFDEEPLERVNAAVSELRAVADVRNDSTVTRDFERFASLCAERHQWRDQKARSNRMLGVHGYWHTMAALVDLMRRYERRHDLEFERVVFSRPDLVHLRSAGLWCGFPTGTAVHSVGADCLGLFGPGNHNCERVSGIDFWWTAPRDYADVIADVAAAILDCTYPLSNNERAYTHHVAPLAKERQISFKATPSSHPGLAVIQRPSPSDVRPGMQGVGSDLKLWGERAARNVASFLYNATLPDDCSMFISLCTERPQHCPSRCRRSPPPGDTLAPEDDTGAPLHNLSTANHTAAWCLQHYGKQCATKHHRHCPPKCTQTRDVI